MSKTDSQIQSDISSNEDRALRGAGAVIFGLVLEAGLVTAKSLGYDHPGIENWGAVIANWFVALGVYIEIRFGRIAAEGNSELRSRADARAAILEKEAADARGRVADIERLTAWRHIEPESLRRLAVELGPIAPQLDVFIEYQNGDAEAWSYANEMADVFSAAGVIGPINGNARLWMREPMFDLFIWKHPDVNVPYIVSAFGKAGIRFSAIEHDPLWLAPKRPAPNVRIFVGPKPAPSFPRIPYGDDDATDAAAQNESDKRE